MRCWGVTEILEKVSRKEPYVKETLFNFNAKDVDLLPEKPDYLSLKRLQLLFVAPWVAHLMSPARPNTELAKMQKRVGAVNRGMINAASLSS